MELLSTLQSLLTQLSDLGDKECILEMQADGVSRWSCAEVATLARQLAAGLVGAGVQRGDFVPVLAHNRPEWVIAALAVIGAGAAISPLDTQISTSNLEQVLRDSAARFIFTTTNYLNRLRQLNLGIELRPILFDVEPDDPRGWRVLLAESAPPLPQVEPDEPAALFYTSGTTGVPKGVPLTHRNLTFQIGALQAAKLLRADDRVLLPLPMYHVYPFTIGTLTPLAFGLPLILPQALTGPQLVRALNEGDVTIIIGVPRVYRAVYSGIENQIAGRGRIAASLFQTALQTSIWLRQKMGWQIGQTLFRPLRAKLGPKLRLLASGGSALDPELAWTLEGFGWNLAIGYGLTETSPMLTMNLPGDGPPKLASVGPALPGLDLRVEPIAQTEETSAEANELIPAEGEIQARGVSVFSGYRNLPEQTSQALTADGWFRTGDLGYFDQDGYLYISGRASTLIVLEGGKKIQPEPLEELYQQHEFIREIGILYLDKQLVAVIVPEIEPITRLRNGDVEQAIREAVSDRLKAVASYQRITDYAITEEPLPRTNLGKIRRHLLPSLYTQAKQGLVQSDSAATGPMPIADMAEKDQALLAQPAARQVWELLAQRYPDKRLSPDTSPQLDLGVDSLEWLTLTLEVSERTGVELSDTAIGRISTVRDLLQEVSTTESAAATPAKLANPEDLLTAEQKSWLTPPGPLLRALWAILFPIYRLLARLVFQVKAYGLENLPAEGNFVLTPNHSSMLDAPMIAAVLPDRHLRQTHWAGAAEIMLSNPLMRLVSRMAGVLPIERFGGGTGIKNLALALAVLKRGRNVVWFPEGRISTTGTLLPFREGIGLVLEQCPALVVPVYIHGTREAMPPDTAWPRPGRVTVTFGPPCDPHELAQQGQGDNTAARMVQALQERVAALASPQPSTQLQQDSAEASRVSE